jgi:hypothetical protein
VRPTRQTSAPRHRAMPGRWVRWSDHKPPRGRHAILAAAENRQEYTRRSAPVARHQTAAACAVGSGSRSAKP